MGPFQVISTAIFSIVFIYVSHQITRFAKLHTITNFAIILFLGAVFLGTLILFNQLAAPKDPADAGASDLTVNVGMTLLAYINFIVSFVLLRDIVGFIDRAFLNSRYSDVLYGNTSSYLLLLLPVVAIVLGNLVVIAGPKLVKIELASRELPAQLDGLRIVHLTDIHIGPNVSSRTVEKIVEKSNSLNPDLVFLTGDILDAFPDKYEKDLKTLSSLKAKHGVFYVYGNHEYYWNFKLSQSAFQKMDFHILENSVYGLNIQGANLQIAGITDPAAARFNEEAPNLSKIAELYQPDAFKILLAHQPFIAPRVSQIGTHLQFSGHTHGGQFFPWNFLIVFFQKYIKGLYEVGEMQLYVNQGTGYWGPSLRLGTYSEITEIILRKK